MASLGSLVVSLEANTAQFTSAMDKSAYQTEKVMRQMRQDAEAVGRAVGLMGVAAAGGLAILVKQSIDAADNLRDMSQKTGIAVEELNGLGFAAGQAGGNLESMGAAAGKLNKSIADAAGGGKDTGAAFTALGINVLDASGNLKKADVVMAEVADQFAKFQDGPEKSALALALFGKAGADMIPLLNDGGTAMRENIEYAKQYSGATTELSNAADNFNDTMGKLTIQQQSFSNAMASAVLPLLQKIAEETLNASEQSDKFSLATEAVKTVLETFIVVGSEVAFTFNAVGTEIGGIAAQLVALSKFDMQGFNAISEAMKEDAAKARQEHDAFIAGVLDRTPNVSVSGAPVDRSKPNASRLPVATPARAKAASGKSDEEKALEEGARLVAKLKEQSEAYGLTGAALLSYQLEQSKMPQAYKDQALALQTNIDALKAETEAEKIRAANQKQIEDEAARATQQNEARVEQIKFSLMSEVEQEQFAHELRLEELQAFHDAKLENVIEANALIEAEHERHEKTKADIQASYQLQSLAMFGNATDQLYNLMKKSGADQTALGKAVFLASKAIAVAEIIMNTEVAAAKAGSQLGIFGIQMATVIRATGYASAGMVAGMAIADVSAEGGFDVPAGSSPLARLHEKEMVLPKAQADVVRGLATKGSSSEGMQLTIVNQTTGRIDSVVEQRISENERALIIQESVAATAAQFSDPNSKTSRAMGRNFAVQRSR